jgi:hypothetical protein
MFRGCAESTRLIPLRGNRFRRKKERARERERERESEREGETALKVEINILKVVRVASAEVR